MDMKGIILSSLCVVVILLAQSSMPVFNTVEKVESDMQTTAWTFDWDGTYEVKLHFVVGTNNVITATVRAYNNGSWTNYQFDHVKSGGTIMPRIDGSYSFCGTVATSGGNITTDCHGIMPPVIEEPAT